MKVLQIHCWGDAANVTGSVEKVIDSFARMDEADIELMFASLSTGAAQQRHGKTFHTFTESAWRNRLFNKWSGLGAFTFPSLVRLIETLHPDLLHFHNRQALVDPLMARLSWQPKVICHYHRRFGEFVIPRSANRLLTVSNAIRSALIEATGTTKPVSVVYNPVPDFVAGDIGQESATRKLRLIYAGGLQQHKGFDEFLQAIAQYSERDDLEIDICGPKLDGFAAPAPNVRVLGLLDHSAFKKRLEAAHIVVHPSHFEGFSLLALEAMSNRKLLVATRGGGLAELVDSDCALVSEIGNAQSLTAAIAAAVDLFAAQHEADRDRLLDAAQAKSACFSITPINQELAKCYRAVLKQ